MFLFCDFAAARGIKEGSGASRAPHARTRRSQRRGMDGVGAAAAISAAARRARSAAARHAGGAQRGAMDSAHRGAMAGTAEEVSAVSNLPPALSAMGAQWAAGEGAAGVGEGTAPSRVAAAGGRLAGRQFREREKGGLAVGPTKRGKGTKIMAIAAVTSLPLAITVDSASPHETKLIDETLAGSFLDQLPARLIGDRAYDSDGLDRRLERDYGIEMIAPNRENRSQTQDGRPLRRYKRRWRVERLFAWLQWFRRLVTRYEYHIENFLGMVRLGCMRIMLRYL